MAEISDISQEGANPSRAGAVFAACAVDVWFAHEVLPLEAALMQFLRHNWRNKSDIADLLQDVYVRVYEAALKQIPESARAFVFATARNLLINRVRREQIIPIEAVADLDALGIAMDEPGPDRNVIARDELRRLQEILDRLPRRSREAIVMKQVEGLSRREIAARMGVTEKTVKWHLNEGVRALADILYGEPVVQRGKA
jgi:RNA polymerase sigma factor (sigma-70 family)